jgi:hypothetical protein
MCSPPRGEGALLPQLAPDAPRQLLAILFICGKKLPFIGKFMPQAAKKAA